MTEVNRLNLSIQRIRESICIMEDHFNNMIADMGSEFYYLLVLIKVEIALRFDVGPDVDLNGATRYGARHYIPVDQGRRPY